ncbi:MAG: GatB/YqeY domain-containing protein [Alphaproteobacteria bacterium]
MRQTLTSSLKEAMKAKEQKKVSTIRLILAALKDRDIAARAEGGETDAGISDADILQLLQKMVKQRQDSIQAYTQADRQDLADQEANEIEIIQAFLPKSLSDEEVQTAIDTSIETVEATSIKDMGKVMAQLRERFPGQIDFGKASGLIKQALNAKS